MLCAKCQVNEATIHVTTVLGTEQETVDFCRNCAPPSLGDLDDEKAKAKVRSILAEKCEFCGTTAYSEQMLAGGGPIYLCFDCDAELRSIVLESLKIERPDLVRRSKEAASVSLSSDPVLSRRSIQLLKERKRESGRDQQS